jgi:hypothetical protein
MLNAVILFVSNINSIHVLSSCLVLALISALTFSMPHTCSEFNMRRQLTISNRPRCSPNSNDISPTLHIRPIIPKHGTLILHQSSCPRDRNLHQQPIHRNSVECYKPFTAVRHPDDACTGCAVKGSHCRCAVAAQREVGFGGEFEVGAP